MKKVVVITLLALICGYTASIAQDHQKEKEAAISAAKEWLTLIDEQKYAESWKDAAELFRNAIPQESWTVTVQSVRKPFGRTVGRELLSGTYRTTLPGAPDGEYVVIQFKTTFDNNVSATETITPSLDREGKWRVSGYFIK